ncbi:uncharacterized protein LOC129412234 [Boleophthalmus pectinirostris]|uniref:uncharacterized protein LOC129412234 n=1 Tax=Boleophthalmus pectinirostris TaxID=150288 RepID=UPI00242FAA45|nr:uncharacterized protein LOC129412234 [Boleophthalmus pectinirostris]
MLNKEFNRRQRSHSMSRADNTDEIPRLKKTLSYAASLSSDNERHHHKMTKKIAPPPYQRITSKSSKPRTTPASMRSSDRVTLFTPQITHKVHGGELALTPVEAPSRQLELQIESLQNQMSALTQIMEVEKKMSQHDDEEQNERHMRKQDMIHQDARKTSMNLDKEITVGTSRSLLSRTKENETRGATAEVLTKQNNEAFQVTGLFSGLVDNTEYEEAQINGIIDPTLRRQEEPAAVYPIRMDGQQIVYQPFSLKDWSALMLTLPKLTKGGVPWMRALLKQTAGDKLCWGDIQAALIEAADETVAGNIKRAIEGRIRVQLQNNLAIHIFRDALEGELRTRFPCIVTDELLSMQMRDNEDYYSYKQRGTNLYHDVTGEPIEVGTGMSVMFRSTLVKGMPKSVQEALQNIMGLYSKPEDEFDAHCNHQVNKWQKDKKEIEEKKQELELATAKLQLQKYQDELKEKKKEKNSKVMKIQPETPEDDISPITEQLVTAIKMVMKSQQPQETTMTPNTQQGQPMQIPNVTIYNGPQARNQGGPRYPGKNKGTININNSRLNDRCFACQGIGHWRKDCPATAQRPRQGPNHFQQHMQPMRGYNQQQFMQPTMPSYNAPVGMPRQTAVPLPPAPNGRIMNVGNQYQGGGDFHGMFE